MLVPIGIQKDTGETVVISDLDISQRGLKCNCICPNPDCHSPLQARFCTSKINYFAHHRSKATNRCAMSAIHLMAQEYLLTAGNLTLPQHRILSESTFTDLFGKCYEHSPLYTFGSPMRISNSAKEIEMGGRGGIKCDILTEANFDGIEFPLNVEVKVTHKVDTEKLNKIRRLDITTVEIDLFHLLKLPEVTMERIAEEIDYYRNMKLLHVSQSIGSMALETELQLRKQTEAVVAKANKQWLISVSELIKSPDFKLPSFIIPDRRTEYWDWFKTQARFKDQLELRSDMKVKLTRVQDSTIWLHMENIDTPLALRIMTQNEALDRVLKHDEDFLFIDPSHASKHAMCSEIEWGKNSLLLEKSRQQYSLAESEFNLHLMSVKRQIQNLRSKLNKLLVQFKSNPPPAIISSAKKARAWLIENLREEDARKICAPLQLNKIDIHLFGVPNSVWQPIVGYLYFSRKAWYGKAVIDELEKLGIKVTMEYRQLQALDPITYKSGSTLVQTFLINTVTVIRLAKEYVTTNNPHGHRVRFSDK